MINHRRAARWTATLVAALCAGGVGRADAQDTLSFAEHVKPILARRCFSCHGPDVAQSGLQLHKQETALAELDSGARAITPGEPGQSELIARVSAQEPGVRMPPEGKPLSDEEIARLRDWIKQGAEWEAHWAFVPPQPQDVPEVERDQWTRNPIDAFILAGLRDAGLEPAEPADRRTLAYRAYYNVTGLPPTRDQLERFLADESPDAWARLVDQLLDSPHYGEHWARHWLDLVRYAQTNSFERDGLKPNAWKYRDYVIRSLNADKPYDQFLREQLAGDELDEVTEETIIATGYYRLGIWDDEPADPLQARYDEWDDIISTTSQVMLGLTVGCARCHDHKIDPIPQADYYGMLAFFAGVTPYGERGDQETNSQWVNESPELAKARRELQRKRRRIERERVAMEEAGIQRMSAADQRRSETAERDELLDEKLRQYLNPSEWELYQETLAREKAARQKIRDLPRAERFLALARCEPHPGPTHIMQRGNPHAPGEVVAPHFPEIFGDPPPEIPRAAPDAHSAGRRRVLADWMASDDNMLTARVIVNRVWQHHFGRGIVRSTNNFGQLGAPPTHPELLDWLALWLVDNDWRLKPLHRLIMTSSAYRMASRGSERALAADPTNDLFWRFDLRRLSSEEIRDSMLVVTGELNDKMFGPSFYPKLSQEVLNTQSRPGDGWGESPPEERARRTVYTFIKRSLLPPFQTAFDFPDVDTSCDARFVTVQPGQALTLLNGAFANERAMKLAERVREEAGDQPRRMIAHALELTLNRPPEEDEIVEGLQLIDRLQAEHGLTFDEALEQWCLTTLNLSEFIYVD